jgi:hypothetical protein
MLSKIPQGRIMEFEVADERGNRPMRLRFDRRWMYLDRKLLTISPVPMEAGKWFEIELKFDCGKQSYDLLLNGKLERKGVEFAEKVDTLERMVFRTGPYRNDVRSMIVDDEPRPSGLYTEDLPGSGIKVPATVILIDDVKTK